MVHSRAFAGTERHILGVSREMRDMGHSVVLACPASAQAYRAAAQIAGLRVITEVSARRLEGVDVIHCHDGRSTLAGALAVVGRPALFLRTQHFVHPASMDRTGMSKTLSLVGHRAINARLDGYICVSREAARSSEKRGEISAPVRVIPPGIAVPHTNTWKDSVIERSKAAHCVVISAGRLEDERRLDTLIRAIALVLPQHPTCQLVVAGDGQATSRLRDLADDLGIAPAVRWLGWIPDLQSVLGGAHLYVNTWPAEGFGMATAEAMAAGVPVVVPTSGAAPELIAGGEGGWTFPPNDARALATLMTGLLSDRSRLAEQGERARGRAAALYSVTFAARAMCEFYETLSSRQNHRAAPWTGIV
jgi:glycosyltransferase involved in cell wall biosynthesis